MLPERGEVYLVDLNPTQGREQRGRRPCLVVSTAALNASPADLVTVLPLTTRDRGIPSHVRVAQGEGGLRQETFVLVEQIRTISKSRLLNALGQVTPQTMQEVERWMRFFLLLMRRVDPGGALLRDCHPR